MKAILGTANEFLDNGAIGPTKFYLATGKITLFAKWKMMYRIKHMYEKYKYSVIDFDILPYIIHTNEQWLLHILEHMSTTDIVELDQNIYNTMLDLIQSNMQSDR